MQSLAGVRLGSILCCMADEKPKLDTFREYVESLRSKTSGTGTSILLDPKADEDKIAFLDKLLEGGKPEKVVDLMQWLKEQVEHTKGATQKKAAETNAVDSELANQWLNKHWKKRNCAICDQVTWAMAPAFAHVPMSLLGRHSPVHSFPCVVLTCRICGNTLFFNAIAMDLLPEGAE